MITEGFELARNKALEVLEDVKIKREVDRDTLIQVARTSLRTKVHQELADLLTEVGRIKIDVGPDRELSGRVLDQTERLTGTL